MLILDLASGEVERTLRFPAALYGQGYELTPEADLRRHAIPDEAQTTHVNAAHRAGGSRLVVSTFIPGAIGRFDLATGGYEELCRGFVGCHGARVSAEGEVYFADSTAGALVFLTPEGTVARRFATGSRWLHDVAADRRQRLRLRPGGQQRAAGLRRRDAASCSARRRFRTWPLPGLFAAARRLPGWLGNSVQALGFYPVDR